MKRFVIDLATFPEEGKSYSGKLDPEIFDLPDSDRVAPKGPLEFNLHAQRFESELFLQGSLSAEISFQCARCLNPVVISIQLDNTAISHEISEEGEIDLTEALREEVVIEFPSYPNCDDAEPPQKCFVDLKYFAVDKPEDSGVKTPPQQEVSSDWSALDALSELPADSQDSPE